MDRGASSTTIAQVFCTAFAPAARGSGAASQLLYCTRVAPTDFFRPFAQHAKSESGWRYYELNASHSPFITAPEELAALLVTIVSDC